jgi:hypothetical protein
MVDLIECNNTHIHAGCSETTGINRPAPSWAEENRLSQLSSHLRRLVIMTDTVERHSSSVVS